MLVYRYKEKKTEKKYIIMSMIVRSSTSLTSKIEIKPQYDNILSIKIAGMKKKENTKFW